MIVIHILSSEEGRPATSPEDVDTHNRVLLRDHVLTIPVVGQIYEVTLEHWHTKTRKVALLRKVDEDDCEWRFPDKGYELEVSYDWDVVEIWPLAK